MSDSLNPVGSRAMAIASALAHATGGEKAAARRMGPEGAPVFWRMVARFDMSPNEEPAWHAITKALALLTPASATESIHADGRKFGAVLADGGDAQATLDKPVFSELRLARLLAVRGAARYDALERAVRMLARKHPKIDVPSLAWAYLNEEGQRIARSYYRRLDQSARTREKETQNV
ncbi:type I-E CRISPR-associated protein Cse2/CasB [Rhodalgimonas zhirmunskyi]|uniref:Type I-E CRISPR-associated protein Cse2/CasB n=1 Tax=Rhodalgimonas zhirmunskyi TaxID=2964767 RepID=A0AAJ1U3Z7_9RHOB|nr:type I-E CRISPR-associated protein Cse2/CasB [Rhodoalgimonas zhirmunskyi]MDQ2093286.1 type I-E CRISPR-associated protein Cse2/CasB [Rhodoalgimonas zhirmunskyi]